MSEYKILDILPLVIKVQEGPQDVAGRIDFVQGLEDEINAGYCQGYSFVAIVPEWNLAVFRRRPSDEG